MKTDQKPTPRPDARLHVRSGCDDDSDGERAPHMHVQQTWALYLGNRDMTLVLKALGGRLVGPNDEAAASDLCDRLTLLRGNAAAEVNTGVVRAADAVRAKQAES